MVQAEHRREELAWVIPVLEKALGNNSRIAESIRAGELPTVFGLAEQSVAALGPDHPDREIEVVALVYRALGGLLLEVDPETNEREKIVGACADLGRLGAWLVKARPQTLEGAHCLLVLARDILDISATAPESALARGPVMALLNNAGKAVNHGNKTTVQSAEPIAEQTALRATSEGSPCPGTKP